MGLMDVFQNAKDWVLDKSNAFLHGEADYQNNYYGAEDAEEFAALQEEPAEQPRQEAAQPQQGEATHTPEPESHQ